MKLDMSFYRGKSVLITGHTGFKGSWLCKMLLDAGAQVHGYSLEPPTDPSLFALLNLGSRMDSTIGDVRDLPHLRETFARTQPEVVLHLAAQPLVRQSYKEPAYTYETNVMGTVNVLECVRTCPSVKSFLNVTTDKVYLNREWERGYREDDYLDGYDPYSNSKSCSELVTHSYRKSFFADGHVAISTARAGNVIGGGDFAADRVIPDCVRAVQAGVPMVVRNPHSTRPYQHVLEPLYVYLMLAQWQCQDGNLAGWYNVGPDDCDCVTTGALVTLFCDTWNAGLPAGATRLVWEDHFDGGPHEANFLKLDCGKLKQTFGWHPRWHMEEAIARTVEWTRAYRQGEDLDACMTREIGEFLNQDQPTTEE